MLDRHSPCSTTWTLGISVQLSQRLALVLLTERVLLLEHLFVEGVRVRLLDRVGLVRPRWGLGGAVPVAVEPADDALVPFLAEDDRVPPGAELGVALVDGDDRLLIGDGQP